MEAVPSPQNSTPPNAPRGDPREGTPEAELAQPSPDSPIRFPQSSEALHQRIEDLSRALEQARATISGQGIKIDSQAATIKALSSTLEAQRLDAFAALAEKAISTRDRGIALGILGLSTALSGDELIAAAHKLADKQRAIPLEAEQAAAGVLSSLREHTKDLFSLAADLGVGAKRPNFSVLTSADCFNFLGDIRQRLVRYRTEQSSKKGERDKVREDLTLRLKTKVDEATKLTKDLTERESELKAARAQSDSQASEILRVAALLKESVQAAEALRGSNAALQSRLDAARSDLDLSLAGEAAASAANRILHLKASGALGELERQRVLNAKLAASLQERDAELVSARVNPRVSPTLEALASAVGEASDGAFTATVEAIIAPLTSSESNKSAFFDSLLASREAPKLLAKIASRLSRISDKAAEVEAEDEATSEQSTFEQTSEILQRLVGLTHDFVAARNSAGFLTLMPVDDAHPFLTSASKEVSQQLLAFLLVDPSLTHAMHASATIKILGELDSRVLAFTLEKLPPREAARLLCSAHLLFTGCLELRKWFIEEAPEGTEPHSAAGMGEKVDLIEGVNLKAKEFPSEAQILQGTKRYLNCLPLMQTEPLQALLKQLLSDEGRKEIYDSYTVDTRDVLLLAQSPSLTERVIAAVR